MTDKPPDERFDDDRLLAYALDLAQDAELEQALATDAALRERLRSMRADLSAVEDQVRAAVPAPEESWADLSAARWDGLRPYFATRPAPRRRRLSLRVLAPAVGIAAAAALAVGIALSQTGGLGGARSESAHAVAGAVAAAHAGRRQVHVGCTPPSVPTPPTIRRSWWPAPPPSTDGVQDFTVLRTLKGNAGQSVRLQVEAGGALKEGSLALLLLTPVDTLGGSNAPRPLPHPRPAPRASAAAGSPAPSVTGASPAPPPPLSSPSATPTAGRTGRKPPLPVQRHAGRREDPAGRHRPRLGHAALTAPRRAHRAPVGVRRRRCRQRAAAPPNPYVAAAAQFGGSDMFRNPLMVETCRHLKIRGTDIRTPGPSPSPQGPGYCGLSARRAAR